jgi:hypothetical protein
MLAKVKELALAHRDLHASSNISSLKKLSFFDQHIFVKISERTLSTYPRLCLLPIAEICAHKYNEIN